MSLPVIFFLEGLVANLRSSVVHSLYAAVITTVDPNDDSAIDIAPIAHLTECDLLQAPCESSCFANLTIVRVILHDTFSALSRVSSQYSAKIVRRNL